MGRIISQHRYIPPLFLQYHSARAICGQIVAFREITRMSPCIGLQKVMVTACLVYQRCIAIGTNAGDMQWDATLSQHRHLYRHKLLVSPFSLHGFPAAEHDGADYCSCRGTANLRLIVVRKKLTTTSGAKEIQETGVAPPVWRCS